MRLFVALDLPDVLRKACSEQADALRSPFEEREIDVRWTDPATYHLTLRFIGDCDQEQARGYREALNSVDAPAADVRPFGLRVLPSRLSPRVVMIGAEQTPSIADVYTTVSEQLEAAGLDEADKTFRPHITIGRLQDAEPEAVHHALRAANNVDLPSVSISKVTLFQSHLESDGARHEVVDTFALNGA
ncbi:RNA 2',3'-cyclic phosphodiesterase [Longibacter salinarum]|uniref:RNA 2',3'-cyclic phosphodiesterase n=1 Tax=Longibacter salinarum TaxID=1850348 RepID=A0A2A8D3L3_9BACT|nr:RNA 2',3'-cyclic phosphodiesterase [Longibacter salinarum]PEN15228.1 RNA 2',3'-cyclic phosphodiesterase [Longibacter salinarum]